MTQEEFAQKLRSGVVRFTFEKKNGEVRPARGTLKMDLIPVADHPKGDVSSTSGSAGAGQATNQKYYDLDKNAWRSFGWDKLRELL